MKSAPYIVLGLLIAGIMRYYVPSGTLHNQLESGSAKSLLKSVVIGCVLPLCSCGTIPLGIGLFRTGATLGNALAFMTSTPVLSPVLIILSLTLLGWKLTLILVATAVIGAYIIGFLGNRIFKDPEKEMGRQILKFDYHRCSHNNEPKLKIAKTLKWSFSDLGADVSVDILIGLAVASFLLAFFSPDWVSAWLGQQEITTLIFVILLGIPVYACSVPSVVVVFGLLLLGATPGAAIAFLISSPATNLGELNVIRKSMGIRPMAFYALSLLLFAVISGLITDQLVFPDYQYQACRIQGELAVQQCCVPSFWCDSVGGSSTNTIPLWHWPLGILFGAVMIFGVAKKLQFFFINPCKGCTWRSYGPNGTCGSKCHVRRMYEFFRTRVS